MNRETPLEQRQRLEAKRIAETDADLIKCLECGMQFKRVGSHVVQVHGYESTAEYRVAHGLMAKETRIPEYASVMRVKARNFDNLENGASHRFHKGGEHGETVRNFWSNRRQKVGGR